MVLRPFLREFLIFETLIRQRTMGKPEREDPNRV